jgi:hypothetical protein
MQAMADAHAIAERAFALLPVVGGLGVGSIVQLLPFQVSARVPLVLKWSETYW